MSKTVEYYFSRKQIIIIWRDGDEKAGAQPFPRNEKGQARANKKIAEMQGKGYTYTGRRKDWYETLLDEARAPRPAQEGNTK